MTDLGEEQRETYKTATTKVSERIRSLAISGVAIIWYFSEQDTFRSLPIPLFIILLLLVAAVLLDLLQYYFTATEADKHRREFEDEQKKSRKNSNTKRQDVRATDEKAYKVPHLLYVAKVSFIILAYLLFLVYLLTTRSIDPTWKAKPKENKPTAIATPQQPL